MRIEGLLQPLLPVKQRTKLSSVSRYPWICTCSDVVFSTRKAILKEFVGYTEVGYVPE
jgi:hypothetical protein